MVTRKAGKPAGRNAVKDAEVKTAYHDEVLNWLIDKLDVVVADRWGMSPDGLAVALQEARQAVSLWITEELAEELASYLDGSRRPLGAKAKAALSEAAARIPDVLAGVAKWEPRQDIGNSFLKTHEVMKQVCRVEQRPMTSDKRLDAGYVDVAATIFMPNELMLVLKGFSSSPEGLLGNFHSSELSSGLDDKAIESIASAFKRSSLTMHPLGDELEVWFSVRTGAFTLGEILQELKALKNLEDKAQEVALVVDGIDQKMRERIEHEGFVVIDREDYRN